MLFIIESHDVGNEVQEKMINLAPEYKGGTWVTWGRLKKGLPKILGIEKLPVLPSSFRLVELMHNYGTKALLLQWARFISIRGNPAVVVSDQDKQLTSSSNTAAYNAKESPDNWGWDEPKQMGARAGTSWVFVPAGCQFRNGLAKARVCAIKRTISHMLASTINGEKLTLNYTELATLLTKAANIVNDRPIGIKNITEDELVPLTINQLLLGRTSSTPPPDHELRVRSQSRCQSVRSPYPGVRSLVSLVWLAQL